MYVLIRYQPTHLPIFAKCSQLGRILTCSTLFLMLCCRTVTQQRQGRVITNSDCVIVYVRAYSLPTNSFANFREMFATWPNSHLLNIVFDALLQNCYSTTTGPCYHKQRLRHCLCTCLFVTNQLICQFSRNVRNLAEFSLAQHCF